MKQGQTYLFLCLNAQFIWNFIIYLNFFYLPRVFFILDEVHFNNKYNINVYVYNVYVSLK